MSNLKLRTQFHLKQVILHLKPKRRKLFRQKDSSMLKPHIPTLSNPTSYVAEAEKIEQNMLSLHKRIKSKKKQKLFDLFAENINLFCRLNKQKSTYEQLFSKNKENRQPKKKLKRCTSAHVNRMRTFQQQIYSKESFSLLRRQRPMSSYSSKNHRKLLTIQSQF